jgi:hypothetical protein
MKGLNFRQIRLLLTFLTFSRASGPLPRATARNAASPVAACHLSGYPFGRLWCRLVQLLPDPVARRTTILAALASPADQTFF